MDPLDTSPVLCLVIWVIGTQYTLCYAKLHDHMQNHDPRSYYTSAGNKKYISSWNVSNSKWIMWLHVGVKFITKTMSMAKYQPHEVTLQSPQDVTSLLNMQVGSFSFKCNQPEEEKGTAIRVQPSTIATKLVTLNSSASSAFSNWRQMHTTLDKFSHLVWW